MRILVVEDDSFTRMSIASTLRLAGMSTIEAGNAGDAFRFCKKEDFRAALIDVHLGLGPNGIELAHALRSIKPSLGIVFLTSYASPRLISPNMELPPGSIYINKSEVSEPETLLQALEKSTQRKSEKPSFKSRLDKLTDLQIETVRLVAEGYSNSEIAKLRFVTEATVEKTLARVARELGFAATPSKNQRIRIARAYLAESPISENAPE